MVAAAFDPPTASVAFVSPTAWVPSVPPAPSDTVAFAAVRFDMTRL